MIWRELLTEAVERLAGAGVASAEAEARWIVEAASGFEGAEFTTGLDEAATVGGVARFDRSGMVRLIKGAGRGNHRLELETNVDGLRMYAFTFGP